MGAASQRKGADAERELTQILRDHGYDVHRGGSLTYGTVPDLVGLPGIHIECKRQEHVRLTEWMDQAVRDADRFGDGVPAVFHRQSRSPWFVTMRLSDWLRLYKEENTEMLNQVFIMGRLVREPDVRHTQNNDPVAAFTVAVDRDYSKDRQTDFIDCVAWRSTAEYVAKYGTKGRMVVVSGRLQLRDWDDKNGIKHRTAEVVVDNLYFGDSRKAEDPKGSPADSLPF